MNNTNQHSCRERYIIQTVWCGNSLRANTRGVDVKYSLLKNLKLKRWCGGALAQQLARHTTSVPARGRQQIVSRRRTLTVFVTSSHHPAALWWPRSPGCIHCPRCHWWLSHETGRRWTASTLKGREEQRVCYVQHVLVYCASLVLYYIQILHIKLCLQCYREKMCERKVKSFLRLQRKLHVISWIASSDVTYKYQYFLLFVNSLPHC